MPRTGAGGDGGGGTQRRGPTGGQGIPGPIMPPNAWQVGTGACPLLHRAVQGASGCVPGARLPPRRSCTATVRALGPEWAPSLRPTWRTVRGLPSGKSTRDRGGGGGAKATKGLSPQNPSPGTIQFSGYLRIPHFPPIFPPDIWMLIFVLTFPHGNW